MDLDFDFLERNKYRIQLKLGEGSFGQVFKAINTETNQIVAIKVIQNGTSDEVEILQSLKHTNIVEYLDSFQNMSYTYLVMEYVQAGSLEGYKVSNEDELRAIIKQILIAIEYLHSSGIVHRDLKPSNILKDQFNQIKIADFGLSSMVNRTTKALNKNCGTFLFMAPEQHLKQCYSKAVDMWSCGIIMYILQQGIHPFKKYFSKKEFLSEVKNIKVSIPDSLSKTAQNFLRKLLCSDKVNRYNVGQALKHPFISQNKDDPIPMTIKDWINYFNLKTQITLKIKMLMIFGYLMKKSILKVQKANNNYQVKTQSPEKRITLPRVRRRRIISTSVNKSMEIKLPTIIFKRDFQRERIINF